jgi:hypothetical protein
MEEEGAGGGGSESQLRDGHLVTRRLSPWSPASLPRKGLTHVAKGGTLVQVPPQSPTLKGLNHFTWSPRLPGYLSRAFSAATFVNVPSMSGAQASPCFISSMNFTESPSLV